MQKSGLKNFPSKQILVLFLYLMLAISIPIAAYLISYRGNDFDAREHAEEGTITVCASAGAGCDYVGGDGIQQAVDVAEDGDTILIKAGSYVPISYKEFVYTRDTAEGIHTYHNKAFLALGSKTLKIQGEGTVVINGGDPSCQNMIGIGISGEKTITVINVTLTGFRKDADSCDYWTEFCSKGDAIVVIYGSLTISKSKITQNTGSGIFVRENANVEAKALTISENTEGGVYVRADSPDLTTVTTITNSIVKDNPWGGFLTIGNSTTEIKNCTIIQNGTRDLPPDYPYMIGGGIYSYIYNSKSPTLLVVNNIISDNYLEGIYVYESTVSLQNNDVFNNAKENYRGISPGINDLSADPLFVNSPSDLHLQPGSPAINAGDPSIFDPDGSRSDMGAYGGPGACNLDNTLPGCPECVASCTGKTCGDSNGCGAKCTTCPADQTCNTSTWTCQPTCLPDCVGRNCGSNGCGWSCGTCSPGQTCNTSGICTPTGKTCSANADCEWCGQTCAIHDDSAQCPDVMPPEDAECQCVNNACTSVKYRTCTVHSDCEWCGSACVIKESLDRCPLAPISEDAECRCVNSACTSVTKALNADLNGDHAITVSDYAIFISDYLVFKRDGNVNTQSDLNYDSKISVSDYAIFIQAYRNYVKS